jgi:hypothetical protein
MCLSLHMHRLETSTMSVTKTDHGQNALVQQFLNFWLLWTQLNHYWKHEPLSHFYNLNLLPSTHKYHHKTGGKKYTWTRLILLSHEILKHTHCVPRYRCNQEVVNFLTKTVTGPLSRHQGPPGVHGPQAKNCCLRAPTHTWQWHISNILFRHYVVSIVSDLNKILKNLKNSKIHYILGTGYVCLQVKT